MDEDAALFVITNGKDKDGFALQKTQEIPVFVREKSAARMEFYEALKAGIKVKLVLETRAEDWEQSAHIVSGKKEYASQIAYDGAVYDIVRTYKRGKSMAEIICS